ncbi:MAG: hypothetical protein Q9180_005634 [Flavoplaca navasiana]
MQSPSQPPSQSWSVKILRIDVGARNRVFLSTALFLVYDDDRVRFKVRLDGTDVPGFSIELADIDFLVTASARKTVEIRYLSDFKPNVRIRMRTSEGGQEFVDFVRSVASTKLGRYVEEALSSIENNPRTGYLGPPTTPYVGPLPSPPANDEEDSSMEF